MGLTLRVSERSSLSRFDAKTSTLKYLESAIAHQTTGHSCNEAVMVLMKEILSNLSANNQDAKRLHHLFFYFISFLKKKEGDSILAETLLLTNQIRKDVLSVNCYTRIRAMRCVFSFLDVQPIVDNFYSAVKENVSHSSFLVRRCAVSLVSGFFCSDSTKYDDAFSLVQQRLEVEDNPFVLREILRSLSSMALLKDTRSHCEYAALEDENLKGTHPRAEGVSLSHNNNPNIQETNRSENSQHITIMHSSNKAYNDILAGYIARTRDIPALVLEYIVDTTENLQFVFENLQKTPFHAGMRILKEISENQLFRASAFPKKSRQSFKLPHGHSTHEDNVEHSGLDQSKSCKNNSGYDVDNPRIQDSGSRAYKVESKYDALVNCDPSLVLSVLLESNRRTDVVLEILDKKYSPQIISGNLSAFLEILKEQQLLTSEEAFDYLFSAAASSEDLNLISDFLSDHLMACTSTPQKVVVLKAIHSFYQKYTFISTKTIEQLLELLNSEIPPISFEALNIIAAIQNSEKDFNDKDNPPMSSDIKHIVDFSKIKYGKIFRKALSLVSAKITTETEVCSFLDLFEHALSFDRNTQTFKETNLKTPNSSEKSPIICSLSDSNTPFIGNSVALFFERICQNTILSKNTVARVIGLLMLFIEHGKVFQKIDLSSESIINFCIQSISDRFTLTQRHGMLSRSQNERNISAHSDGQCNPSVNVHNKQNDSVLAQSATLSDDFYSTNSLDSLLKEFRSKNFQNKKKTTNTFDQIKFPFSTPKTKKIITQQKLIPQKDTIQQLSTISDPIFIEAKTTITGYEAKITIVLLNRAKSPLQNLLLDLTTSKNLLIQTKMNFNNLKPSEMKTIELRATIKECSDSFITGNLSFIFLKNKQYTGKYSINLIPIKLYIRDFLVKNTYNSEFFIQNWPNLEWENTYTIKIHPNKIRLNKPKTNSNIIEKITHQLRSSLVDCLHYEKYSVCNMVCRTTLGNTILLNFTINNDDLISIEARIRSDSEDVVKSISKILSSIIKR